MGIAFSVGKFIGSTAARTVHYGGVAVESTGQAGKDLVAGTQAGYTTKRCDLAEQRAAKYARIAAEMKQRAEPAAPAVPATAPFRGKVILA